MNKKRILYLMRHGQTLFNLQKKIQGWCDSPLTKLGIYQAHCAKKYFSENNIFFDYAYSSTSERCSDTLEIITNMDYERKKELKEWNFGTLEGESESLNPPLPYGDFFTNYDGESENDLRIRIANELEVIMNKDDHDSVLIVSHGAACAQFYRKWEAFNKVFRNDRLHNCCILKYEYVDDIFILVELWNEEIKQLQPTM